MMHPGFIRALAAQLAKCEDERKRLERDGLIIDFIAAKWDSQGNGGHVLGMLLSNPTGSFRDAVEYRKRLFPSNT
jgi:ABC-type glycerol-3-phosphate transport system substrate-binding protein